MVEPSLDFQMGGNQSIPRAELQAVVLAHEADRGHVVYTDSAYVIDGYDLLQRAPHLHKLSNFDLLSRWHFLIRNRSQHTPAFKVAARRLHDPTSNDTIVCKLGNDVADRIGKYASKQLLQPYVQQVTQCAQHIEHDMKFLQKQFSLRTDLARMRRHILNTSTAHETWTPEPAAREFIHYHAHGAQSFAVLPETWNFCMQADTVQPIQKFCFSVSWHCVGHPGQRGLVLQPELRGSK